jgi:hypothetical protein
MADDGASGAIFGPGDPLAPQEVQAASLLSASQQAGGQRGLGSEFAGLLADAQRAGAVNLIAQITPEKLAAQNDYSAALNYINNDPNSPNYGQYDPVGYVQQNPDMSAFAKYRLMTASPSQVAVDRFNLARGAETGYAAQAAGLRMPGMRAAAQEIASGRAGMAPPLAGEPGSTTGAPGAASGGPLSVDTFAGMTPQQRQTAVSAYKARKAALARQPGAGNPGAAPMFPGATR